MALSAACRDPSGCALYSPGWYKYWTERIRRVFINKTEPPERGCITIEAFRAILVARAEQADPDDGQDCITRKEHDDFCNYDVHD